MAESFPKGGSEYGGLPGLVQPPPHDIAESPWEQAMLALRTDAADPFSSPETVLAEDLRLGRTRS